MESNSFNQETFTEHALGANYSEFKGHLFSPAAYNLLRQNQGNEMIMECDYHNRGRYHGLGE